MYLHIYEHLYLDVFIHEYICAYMYINTYMYIYIYIYIFILINDSARAYQHYSSYEWEGHDKSLLMNSTEERILVV